MIAELPRPVKPLYGGAVLQVARYGSAGQFAEVWTINPFTHEERVVAVHMAPVMPAYCDLVCWHPDADPECYRRGQPEPYAILRRIGPCFDPMGRTPRTA
jgi:hypothetical protein